jgi:hypothetical protein
MEKYYIMDLDYFYTCNNEKADYDKDNYTYSYNKRIEYALEKKLSNYYSFIWYEELPEYIELAIEFYEIFFDDIKTCSTKELDYFVDNDSAKEFLESMKSIIETLTKNCKAFKDAIEKAKEQESSKRYIDAVESYLKFFSSCLYHYKELYSIITGYIAYEKFCRKYLEKSEYSYTEEEVNTILNEVITDYNNKVDDENSTLGEIKSLKERIVSLKNYRKVLLRDNGNIY